MSTYKLIKGDCLDIMKTMPDRNRLIELFRKIKYKPFPDAVTEYNMSDQFTDYALESITDCLISNGAILLPCKVGDTVYRVMSDKRIKHPYEYKVIGFWYSADENCNNAHLVRYVNGIFDSSLSIPFSEFGETTFLSYDEAERAANGNNN